MANASGEHKLVRNEPLGYVAALASAVLVGLFTVLNKWLLTEAVPTLTAGTWTYFAAGCSLLPWAVRAGFPAFRRRSLALGWLAAGSVVGPVFYFLGLKLTSGVQGVLLINLEAVFTAFLAFALFKERLTPVTLFGGCLVLLGGLVVSWPDAPSVLLAGATLGGLLIAVGYLGWATENNLGRLLGEESSVVSLVCVKAFAAAATMGVLAIAFGQPLAVSIHVVPGIVASGAVALGCSLALFYLSMRHIGAGRAGLISSTSALWGVLAALLLLDETLTGKVLLGGLLMLVGLSGFAWETAATNSEVV